jgi:hypothetical protein
METYLVTIEFESPGVDADGNTYVRTGSVDLVEQAAPPRGCGGAGARRVCGDHEGRHYHGQCQDKKSAQLTARAARLVQPRSRPC